MKASDRFVRCRRCHRRIHRAAGPMCRRCGVIIWTADLHTYRRLDPRQQPERSATS